MSYSYYSLLYFHIAIGFASLVLFWIPVAVKKGSALHIRAGHWYANVMYAVGISALCLALMLMTDPIAFKFANNEFDAEQQANVISQTKDIGLFLLAISLLVLVGVRHGLQTIKSKQNHALMRRADSLVSNLSLMVVGLWLGVNATGNSPMNVLFYIFAALCTYTAISNLRYCYKQKVSRSEQIIAHLSAIIGAGIGSHTAFFVFGASRFFEGLLMGYFAIAPWVLPGIVGGVLIARQRKRYQPSKTKFAKLN